MSKPDAPAAPDYKGAAVSEGQSSVQAAIANAILNRPNQSNPYGTQTWSQTGTTKIPAYGDQPGVDIPNYSSSITMSPEGKQLFDSDTAIKLGLMGAGQNALGQVQSSMSKPFDLSTLPAAYNDKVADAMYSKATRNLDPQWATAEDRERTRLINSGFSVGNEGFTNALDQFQRSKDSSYGDARDRSIIAGTEYGQRDRNQAISEMLLQRTQPLTELNSLRTGAAPQIPSFASGNVGSNIQPTNFLGATTATGQANNDIYNADMGAYNSQMQTLGSAAAAAIFF